MMASDVGDDLELINGVLQRCIATLKARMIHDLSDEASFTTCLALYQALMGAQAEIASARALEQHYDTERG